MVNRQPDQRQQCLHAWAIRVAQEQGLCSTANLNIELASDDASFRRYFRAKTDLGSLILVDAPPDREDNRAFVQVAQLLVKAGIKVPEIIKADLERGFLILSDLGDRHYLDTLRAQRDQDSQALYATAMQTLVLMRNIDCATLPRYDEVKLQAEMALLPTWFLSKALSLQLTPNEETMLAAVSQVLITNALEQPQGFVHRDFHCRNLMLTEPPPTGGIALAVIDFQDAVLGPCTYDLVSLLKDCYWRLPGQQVEALALAQRDFMALAVTDEVFLRWFHLMGMQRHLKCVGIFSRLHLRDGKPNYRQNIPLVMNYLLEVCEKYAELQRLGAWLLEKVVPAMNRYLP